VRLLRYGLALSLLLTALLSLVLPLVVAAAEPIITITSTPIIAPTVISFPATEITAISARLNGSITNTGNEDAHTRGFEWGLSTGNYTLSWNETGIFGIGIFFTTVGNLTLGQEVFWRAFAMNSYSMAYSAERSFFPSLLPNAPTNFQATQTGVNQVTLTWTMGLGAVNTTIRAAENSPPASLTGGYEVYTGGDTSVNVTLTLGELSSYGFSAWSYNPYGYSIDYATATIGGTMILTMVLGLLALGLTVAMFATKNSMLGFPSGIFWAIFGGANYLTSTATWDIYYLLFFAAIGMFIFSIFAAFALRHRDLAGPDADKGAFIDEGGRRRTKTEQAPWDLEPVRESPGRSGSWGDIDRMGMHDMDDNLATASSARERLQDRARKRKAKVSWGEFK